MRVIRHLGTISLVGLLPLALAGCGGDSGGGDDRAKVDAVEQQAVEAVDGVLHDVAEQTGATFVGGNRFFSPCGPPYAPRGVVMVSFLQLGPAEKLASDDEAADLAGTLLEDDGWAVERGKEGAVVRGTKGELKLKIEFGVATVFSIDTECIEVSRGVGEDYDELDIEVRWR